LGRGGHRGGCGSTAAADEADEKGGGAGNGPAPEAPWLLDLSPGGRSGGEVG